MSQTSPIKVLALGLPLPKEMDPDGDMASKIKAGAAQNNIDLNLRIVDVENQSHEKITDDLKETLKDGPYDMVSIGFGVRGDPKLTEIFEKLVNTVSQVQPGARFAFLTHPQDMFAAVKRVMA